MRMLRLDNYRVMPWKNGRGTTRQIAIFPEDAAFPGDEFLWRVSSAKVTEAGPFSAFPGCDRFLAVWQGAGLLLGTQSLEPLVPQKFSGDEPIE
ncbi:MAG: HutD family protein, partial [Deltaproteobacteria bacterium]|nr:HutD family protein [Deltaproteobacteria bacterium]